MPGNETSFKQYYDDMERQIDKKRIKIIDIRNETYKQLCDFLELKHPKCAEDVPLKKAEINTLRLEVKYPWVTLTLMPIYLLLGYFNYKILYFVLGLIGNVLFF